MHKYKLLTILNHRYDMKNNLLALMKFLLLFILGTGGFIVIIGQMTIFKLNLQKLDPNHLMKMNLIEPILLILIGYLFILWIKFLIKDLDS